MTTNPAAAKVARVEADIAMARLRGDYASAMPPLLKKWRKLMGSQSTILDDVVQAEALLYSLTVPASTAAAVVAAGPLPASAPGSLVSGTTQMQVINTAAPMLAWRWSWSEPAPQAAKLLAEPGPSPKAAAILDDAAALVSRAYATLLENHQVADRASVAKDTLPKPERDLPVPPLTDAARADLKTLMGSSQLYLEIVALKAHILHLRGARTACLRVLTNELELPPSSTVADYELQLRGMGIVYLIKALVLKADCLHAEAMAPAAAPEDRVLPSADACVVERDACLRYLLHLFPSTPVPSSGGDPFNDVSIPLPSAGQWLPFGSPVEPSLLASAHWHDVLAQGLFMGTMTWLQAWMERIVHDREASSPTSAAPATATGPNAAVSLIASLPFPALTFQTLDFVRAYFAAIPAASRADAPQCILLAQWAIRFLVIWSNVVLQITTGQSPGAGAGLPANVFSALPNTLYVDYVPLTTAAVGPTSSGAGAGNLGGYLANSLLEELESLFAAWYGAIVAVYPFPRAGITDLPPPHVNKLMEELAATLEWSDEMTAIKPSSIRLLENTLSHTFHSLLCLRVLSMTHFSTGGVPMGLTLLRRYMEIAKEQFLDPDMRVYEPLMFPQRHARLVQLYDAIGLGRDSMFVHRCDSVDDYAALLVDGSQKLAECNELDQALDIARHARTLVDFKPAPSWKVVCRIYDNLATLLGLSALKCFHGPKRQAMQDEAVALLQQSYALDTKSYRMHYQLALIYADRSQIPQAKAQVKLALKSNRAHIPAWHLLVLLLTASSDLEGAIKLAELGVRECVMHHVPAIATINVANNDDDAGLVVGAGAANTAATRLRSVTFDHLAALARDQQLNQTWSPAEYDELVSALIDLKLTQSRILERVRGTEAAVAVVQELFRWYKLLFDEDVLVQDMSRLRSESVRSTTSGWSLSTMAAGGSPLSGAVHVRLKQRRKRTMLTAALLNGAEAVPGGDDAPDVPGNVRPSFATNTASGTNTPVLRRSLESNPALAAVANDRPRNDSSTSLSSLPSEGGEGSLSGALLSTRRTHILARLWLRLGQIFGGAGQLAEARKALREAEALIPGHTPAASPTASSSGAGVLSPGRGTASPTPGASPRVQGLAAPLNGAAAAAAAAHPVVGQPRSAMAVAFANMGPDSLQDHVWCELAALQYATGSTDQAMTLWHRTLANSPHHVDALLGLAKAHFENGRSHEAELILDDLCQHSGYKSVDAWYYYGKICKEQGKFDLALKSFRTALDLERIEPIQPYSDLPRLSLVTML
ncbi:hypothetical protein GGF31_004487 [Allomyces arbusculus]|nr:hypothetical protein GGF31_004487 [Allomyces arbusculus]